MSRNDACTCGSGKRFKHCHGRFGSTGPSALHLEALAAHQSGALTRAEALYRRAIESNSGDADSLHMLGVVQFERLRYREALEFMWEAAELTGWSDEVVRQNMGLVLAKLLAPQANARQKDFVAAYVASERERKVDPACAARVSVVLLGNTSRFVARAVSSVTRQTYRDIEMIVVVDRCAEEIARAVAESIRPTPLPVKLVSRGDRGEAEAANEGAQRAEGRYLAFLGADEWFAPNRVERMVAEIARAAPLWGYSRVGTAGGDARRGPSDAAMGNAAHDFRSNELASFTLLRRNASESSGNLFIDRELFQTLGGYAEVGDNRGWDLCVRAAKVVEPVVVAEPLYFRDVDRSAGPEVRASDRFVTALVADALKGDAAASNPFCPQFPGNRDLLLRSELRAGRGDRLPVPMLRSLAAEWRNRAPAQAVRRDHGAPAQRQIRKTAVVVLGVYRSGTSAIARTLNLCGAFLPAGVIAEDLRLNPKGFWETEAVNDLDARLLHHLDADWNRVDFDLPREGPLIEEFLANSREVLASEYGDAPLILMKDPRMGVLAPLWHRSLRQCGYRPVYVVAVRNPLEVARSFEAHGDMPIADGLALWLAYMQRMTMFIDGGGVDAACVRYTALLDDWRNVVRRIGRRLDVRLAADGREDEVDRFLDAAMRKHRATEAELEPHLAGGTGDAIRALYRQLLERCDRDADDADMTTSSAANADGVPAAPSELPSAGAVGLPPL
jgi:hypothetical protein